MLDVRSRSLLVVMLALAVVTLFAAAPARAESKLNVVASTTDMASLAREVGGDRISVQSVARGYQDPHYVEAKPSFLLMLKRADLLIYVGLELELGWLPPLIAQCGNPKIQVGASGYFDASRFAQILEIPTTTVTRAQGDVHPLGNPHYWLDPENGHRIAHAIADKLAEMRPNDATYFQQRFEQFDQKLRDAEKRWEAQMQPYRGRKVVSYHNSWPNFAHRFGINVVGYVEPRPGIPPSPGHTIELIQMMKKDGVKIIIVEPYFDLKTPNSVAVATGGKVVVMMPSVGGDKSITDYFSLFDYDINLLTSAFKATQ
jgi:ABC-type Zn uptake system ZnuABC Zn-binding protein ZnuA